MIAEIGAVLSKDDCLALAQFGRHYVISKWGTLLMKRSPDFDEDMWDTIVKLFDQFDDMLREEENYEF